MAPAAVISNAHSNGFTNGIEALKAAAKQTMANGITNGAVIKPTPSPPTETLLATFIQSQKRVQALR